MDKRIADKDDAQRQADEARRRAAASDPEKARKLQEREGK